MHSNKKSPTERVIFAYAESLEAIEQWPFNRFKSLEVSEGRDGILTTVSQQECQEREIDPDYPYRDMIKAMHQMK